VASLPKSAWRLCAARALGRSIDEGGKRLVRRCDLELQYGAGSTRTSNGYSAGAVFTNTESGWVAGGGLEWAPFTGFGCCCELNASTTIGQI